GGTQPPTGAPMLTAPTGTISSPTPTYQWTTVSGATSYRLYVSVNGGANLINSTLRSASVCSGSSCSYAPSTALTSGTSYFWWMQASNSAGSGPWSAGVSFHTP